MSRPCLFFLSCTLTACFISQSSQAIDKEDLSYERYNRAAPYLRLGRSNPEESAYLRLGRTYLRLGKKAAGQSNYLRLGRDQNRSSYLRLGRGGQQSSYLRLGRADSREPRSYLRLGRSGGGAPGGNSGEEQSYEASWPDSWKRSHSFVRLGRSTPAVEEQEHVRTTRSADPYEKLRVWKHKRLLMDTGSHIRLRRKKNGMF